MIDKDQLVESVMQIPLLKSLGFQLSLMINFCLSWQRCGGGDGGHLYKFKSCFQADGREQRAFLVSVSSQLPSAPNNPVTKWRVLGWHLLLSFKRKKEKNYRDFWSETFQAGREQGDIFRVLKENKKQKTANLEVFIQRNYPSKIKKE